MPLCHIRSDWEKRNHKKFYDSKLQEARNGNLFLNTHDFISISFSSYRRYIHIMANIILFLLHPRSYKKKN